jgi:hypothetical protein
MRAIDRSGEGRVPANGKAARLVAEEEPERWGLALSERIGDGPFRATPLNVPTPAQPLTTTATSRIALHTWAGAYAVLQREVGEGCAFQNSWSGRALRPASELLERRGRVLLKECTNRSVLKLAGLLVVDEADLALTRQPQRRGLVRGHEDAQKAGQ